MAVLRAAGAGLGDAALAGLLRKLGAQMPQLIEEIFQALALDDTEALHAAAHQLTGAAANLGAQSLAEVSGRLERAARLSDFESALLAVADIRPIARRTLDAAEAVAAELETAPPTAAAPGGS
jgi:two-component system sensor histidine kinase/response regulator